MYWDQNMRDITNEPSPKVDLTPFQNKLPKLGTINFLLVGSLVAIFYFPINIGLRIIPIDRPYFSEGWPNHQPVWVYLFVLGPKDVHDLRPFGGFQTWSYPKLAGWFRGEHPTRMDEFGVPLF